MGCFYVFLCCMMCCCCVVLFVIVCVLFVFGLLFLCRSLLLLDTVVVFIDEFCLVSFLCVCVLFRLFGLCKSLYGVVFSSLLVCIFIGSCLFLLYFYIFFVLMFYVFVLWFSCLLFCFVVS